jgi:predicted transcriptional regulator
MVGGKGDNAPAHLIAVAPETPVRQALGFITQHNISQLPVVSRATAWGTSPRPR